MATFFSISTFKTIRINQNDSYELFRIQNQLLRFHLFSRYRKSYLSRLITGAQYYEGGTLEEMAITHICCVPSRRSELVKDFAARVAESLKLDFVDILEKTPAKQQKEMENSAYQCANAYKSFFVKENVTAPRNILLIDDVVDSRWTFTVCGYRLMEAGAENIYPFALADSSNRED